MRRSPGALPHFVTEIDGLDIHFIHVRSPHENALPVIIHPRVARLGHRTAERHRRHYAGVRTVIKPTR